MWSAGEMGPHVNWWEGALHMHGKAFEVISGLENLFAGKVSIDKEHICREHDSIRSALFIEYLLNTRHCAGL